MRLGEDGTEKPEVAGEPEGLTPDAGPEEEQEVPNPEDEDQSTATEDPAWSLKESGSE